jgi:hypothetical protein
MASKAGEINFSIRFPGGLVDLAKQRMEDGGYMSRRWVAMVTGAPVDAEGYPTAHPGTRAAASSPKGLRANMSIDADPQQQEAASPLVVVGRSYSR